MTVFVPVVLLVGAFAGVILALAGLLWLAEKAGGRSDG